MDEFLTVSSDLPSVFNPGYMENVPQRVEGLLDVSDPLIAEMVSEELRRFSDPSSPILDIGCGKGFLVGMLSESGYDIGGIDINRKMKPIWAGSAMLRNRCRLADFNAIVTSGAVLSQSAGVIVSSRIFEQAWRVEASRTFRQSTTIDSNLCSKEINLALAPKGLYICFDSLDYIKEIAKYLNQYGIHPTEDSRETMGVFQKL